MATWAIGKDVGLDKTPATGDSANSEVAFDGANYATSAEKLAHGRRIASLLACDACHASDYSGVDFGRMFPTVDGLWATNISLTMPEMSDSTLERLLREGVHPEREIYLMPSKQSQFLAGRDMDALIAFLRTIEPVGEPTPLPPAGFEDAVTKRLPESYWRTTAAGEPRSYHNAAQEAAYFAENTVPPLGEKLERGRMIVQTICAGCHGAALDGVGEPAGDIQAALNYDDALFRRLLRYGIDSDGNELAMNWGSDHVPDALTDEELSAAIAYTKALARKRAASAAGSTRDQPSIVIENVTAVDVRDGSLLGRSAGAG